MLSNYYQEFQPTFGKFLVVQGNLYNTNIDKTLTVKTLIQLHLMQKPEMTSIDYRTSWILKYMPPIKRLADCFENKGGNLELRQQHCFSR